MLCRREEALGAKSGWGLHKTNNNRNKLIKLNLHLLNFLTGVHKTESVPFES